MKAQQELSLADNLDHAFNLALILCYSGCDHEVKCDHECKPVKHIVGATAKQEDDIWSMVDGLWHKYYHDRISGRCSLQASLDFDVTKFEAEIEQLISDMEGLIHENTTGKG